MVTVKMWKTTHRKGFEDEHSVVSLIASTDGAVPLPLTGGPIWIISLQVAEEIFGKGNIDLLPEDGTPVSADLTIRGAFF